MTAPKDDKRNKKTPKDPQGEGFAMPGVDVQQLERLLDFMAAHDLEEFEYEHAGVHIRLRKNPLVARAVVAPSSAALQAAPVPAPPPQARSQPETSAPEAPPPAPPAEELHIVKSPIVGTFYEASSPETGAFVKVGDEIQVGQVVCIIEAMKLMNEIEADAKGELVRVLVENAQPVEYGQPLFAIRTAAKKK
jgi:acetyl-CoA carboxylase biotin carboxyl carrier protein